MVTVRPDIVATDVLLLVNVNAPGLFDEGSVRSNGASSKFLDATVYGWMVGRKSDANGTVALLLALTPDAAWVTVIVVEPPVFGKTIFPHISAMAELPIV
jgi:hypothetical protein